MGTAILPGGTRRAIHVYVPALMKRQEKWKAGVGDPVMAVRSSLYDYEMMRLYRKVEILGPSELVEMKYPLPGTKGRGVAILFTSAPVRVTWDGDKPPKTIDTADRPKESPWIP